MLDYNQLEALAAVVEEGGFERAGGRLHVSQSAVTQRIRQLEELTGQVLLIRSQPPALTARGRILMEHFSKVRLLEKELEHSRDGERELPVIPLAVNADILSTWFSAVAASYMKAGQGLLEIRVADQDLTHTLLAGGEVMGCISADGSAVRACRSNFLGKMNYRLVGTRSYRERYFSQGIEAESFRRAPKLNFNRDDKLINRWVEAVFPGLKGFENFHFIPSFEQFPHLISRGEVCAMVPEEQFLTCRDEMDLVDLSLENPVPVSLYWQRWSIESAQLDYLTDLIRVEAGVRLES